MTKLHIQGMALVAMLLSLPLISWGSTSDIPAGSAPRPEGKAQARRLSLVACRHRSKPQPRPVLR